MFRWATEHDSYFISDLETETRWPDFRAEALAQTKIRSIASFELFTTRDTVGALNLWPSDRLSRQPCASFHPMSWRPVGSPGRCNLATGFSLVLKSLPRPTIFR